MAAIEDFAREQALDGEEASLYAQGFGRALEMIFLRPQAMGQLAAAVREESDTVTPELAPEELEELLSEDVLLLTAFWRRRQAASEEPGGVR